MLLGNPSVVKLVDAFGCESCVSAQLAGYIGDLPSRHPLHRCRQTSDNSMF